MLGLSPIILEHIWVSLPGVQARTACEVQMVDIQAVSIVLPRVGTSRCDSSGHYGLAPGRTGILPACRKGGRLLLPREWFSGAGTVVPFKINKPDFNSLLWYVDKQLEGL